MKLEHEDEYALIRLEGGIVYGEFKHEDITMNIAKHIIEKRKEVCNGIPRPILIDVTQVKSMTKEARDFFGTDEGSYLVNASALVVESPLSSFLANFFIRINLVRSKVPVRVYSKKDKKKAVNWLSQYL